MWLRRLRHGDERRLREECEERLADLPIPTPFSIPALVRNMERARGRRILLRPIPDHLATAGTLCGLRIRKPQFTVVLFRRGATPNRTNHTILHELSHEWFDHRGLVSPRELHRQMPLLTPRLIAQFTDGIPIQGRGRYDTEEEREAELSASLIPLLAEERATRDDIVGRLDHSLSRPIARRHGARRHRGSP